MPLIARCKWTLVKQRIVAAIQDLLNFSERVRASDRIPGTRELVAPKLPYIVFVQVSETALIVLNAVYTAQHFLH